MRGNRKTSNSWISRAKQSWYGGEVREKITVQWSFIVINCSQRACPQNSRPEEALTENLKTVLFSTINAVNSFSE